MPEDDWLEDDEEVDDVAVVGVEVGNAEVMSFSCIIHL